jgi:hypothetical protein
LFGSLISQTHLSKFLFLTPLYTGWRVSLNIFRPARFLGQLAANRCSESSVDVAKKEESLDEIVYEKEELLLVKTICKCCREWKMVVRCKLGIEESVCVRD